MKRGREYLSDVPRAGRPRDEIVDCEIKSILQLHPYATIRMIASIVNKSPDTVFNQLHDMGYKNIRLRWVPHLLTHIQKVNRLKITKNLLEILEESKKSGFTNIISGDESWFIYYY